MQEEDSENLKLTGHIEWKREVEMASNIAKTFAKQRVGRIVKKIAKAYKRLEVVDRLKGHGT